jgi:hypothetical protein
MPPGVLEGLQLVVLDIEAARAELVERGVEASPVQHVDGGEWVEGKGGEWNSFVFFSDPDGNGWVLQECPLAISWLQGSGEPEVGRIDPPTSSACASPRNLLVSV